MPGVAHSRSQHTRDAGEIAQRKLRGREGSNPGPRLWYQVRAPHLANPTIKPRCYSGRGGGLYPWSNIPPTACEPGVARSKSQHTRDAGEIAQRKCVAGRDRTQDLGSGTKLERPT